jgi:tRNA(Ile)-lysidine synthase
MPLSGNCGAISDAEFAELMAPLGEFGAAPRLGVAVSGGADSMALALLASVWARGVGGTILALIVDHGLRVEAAQEADVTRARLAERGIASRILVLRELMHGPALAERARHARYAALAAACAAEGIVYLLIAHHRRDQAETLMLRSLGGSSEAGFTGMARRVETRTLCLLRPLLCLEPARLRATLQALGCAWVNDPSNADASAQRARLRRLVDTAGDADAGTLALSAAAVVAARARAAFGGRAARILAVRAELRPEGFALLGYGAIDPRALALLVATIAGSCYPVSAARLADLAAAPRPATIAGVRLLPAGRHGAGLLIVREERATAPPVAAEAGARWDHRFRLRGGSAIPGGLTIGALGEDAARFRRHSALPSVVLRTMPALRRGGLLWAVPQLGHPAASAGPEIVFDPPIPASGAPFFVG